MTTHTYRTDLTWRGSTGGGHAAYSRRHDVTPVPGVTLTLSADPAFRGDPSLANPEALLVTAASSCQFLSFVGAASRSGVDVVGYVDDVTAEMPDDDKPVRITRIELRPTITVRAGDTSDDEVRHAVDRLVALAHKNCFIANSITADIVIDPTVVIER